MSVHAYSISDYSISDYGIGDYGTGDYGVYDYSARSRLQCAKQTTVREAALAAAVS